RGICPVKLGELREKGSFHEEQLLDGRHVDPEMISWHRGIKQDGHGRPRLATRDMELWDDAAWRDINDVHYLLGPRAVRRHGEDFGDEKYVDLREVGSIAERDRPIVEKPEAGQTRRHVLIRRLPMRQLLAVVAGRDIEREDLVRVPTVRPGAEIAV